jgi:hypothetical protein
MATRTQRKTVTFDHPFLLKGMDRILPPGNYVVVTDEELVEGLSFPVYRRVIDYDDGSSPKSTVLGRDADHRSG